MWGIGQILLSPRRNQDEVWRHSGRSPAAPRVSLCRFEQTHALTSPEKKVSGYTRTHNRLFRIVHRFHRGNEVSTLLATPYKKGGIHEQPPVLHGIFGLMLSNNGFARPPNSRTPVPCTAHIFAHTRSILALTARKHDFTCILCSAGRISSHLFAERRDYPASKRMLNIYRATDWSTSDELIASIRIILPVEH